MPRGVSKGQLFPPIKMEMKRTRGIYLVFSLYICQHLCTLQEVSTL